MIPDYYAVLSVGRDATDLDIRNAYRNLARQYHPDVNSDVQASARFAELSAAYEVLRDPTKRAEFDSRAEAPSAQSSPISDPPISETLIDKLARSVDTLLNNDNTPKLTEQQKSLDHLHNIRIAISRFHELPIAADTCRAFLLAAVSAEPERSATMEAVGHLYLQHEDARNVAVAATPASASDAALNAVTAAIISGAAVDFVDAGILTADPPLGVVDHSTQKIHEVASDRLEMTFEICGFEPLPNVADA